MGVSPRRLMGWEPAEITTHEYADGVLVRSVTVREPEFELADLVSLLKDRADERAPRGSHGFLLSESMNPNADANDWEAEYRYEARGPRKDHAQAAIDGARTAYAKEYPDADLNALRWTAERVQRSKLTD